MKLNHAHLFTGDVAATGSLLTRHFAFAVEQAGEGFAMLRGSDGFSLVLMAFGPEGPRTYPGADAFGLRIATHIGFVVDTADAVRAKHAELRDGGCRPGPINSFEALGQSWTAFYCPIGDGLDLEVTAHG